MSTQIEIEDMHRPPTHPGLMLLEEFLKPLQMTQVELAEAINVPIQRVNEIINQRRGVSPETALRLGKYFDVSASFWLGLQRKYDLWSAYQKEKKNLDNIVPRNAINSVFNRPLDWLDDFVDSLWEPVGTFFSEKALATARSLPERELTLEQVEQLYIKDGQESIPENINLSSTDVADALAYLIRLTNDESIRKESIELLRNISPDHSLFNTTREKDLGPFLNGEEVALRILFFTRIDQRYSVIVQIYPIGENVYLPEGLKLTVIDMNDEERGVYTVHERVNLMHRPLIVEKGEKFSLNIIMGEAKMTENFEI